MSSLKFQLASVCFHSKPKRHELDFVNGKAVKFQLVCVLNEIWAGMDVICCDEDVGRLRVSKSWLASEFFRQRTFERQFFCELLDYYLPAWLSANPNRILNSKKPLNCGKSVKSWLVFAKPNLAAVRQREICLEETLNTFPYLILPSPGCILCHFLYGLKQKAARFITLTSNHDIWRCVSRKCSTEEGKKRKIIHTPNDFFLFASSSLSSHSLSPPRCKRKVAKKPLKAEPWGRQVMCEWIFLRLRFFSLLITRELCGGQDGGGKRSEDNFHCSKFQQLHYSSSSYYELISVMNMFAYELRSHPSSSSVCSASTYEFFVGGNWPPLADCITHRCMGFGQIFPHALSGQWPIKAGTIVQPSSTYHNASPR